MYRDSLGQDLAVGDFILVAAGRGQPTTQIVAKIEKLKFTAKYEPITVPRATPLPTHLTPDDLMMVSHHPNYTVYWDNVNKHTISYRTLERGWEFPYPYKWNTRLTSTYELKKVVKIDPRTIRIPELKKLVK